MFFNPELQLTVARERQGDLIAHAQSVRVLSAARLRRRARGGKAAEGGLGAGQVHSRSWHPRAEAPA
ncbi:MAG: hypothetical protein L0Y54_11345 [Sporichthyaceae bacterium]|nr:hypothetical protein [Sporichthyaceae bacterium]